MTLQLKWSRPLLACLIGITNATAAFLGFLVQFYVHDASLAGATTVFVGAISSVLILYLSTEEASLPPVPSGAQV